MDNSNMTAQTPPAQQPVQPPAQPPPTQPPVQTPPQQAGTAVPAKGGNKMVLWLIVGLVVVILIIGVIYFIFSSQKAKKAASQKSEQTKTTSVKTEDNLDKELDTIDIQAPDSDFDSIDKDLQIL